MSDTRLREVERELAGDPGSLELRRKHVALLTRAGLEEQALSALDLAWRLGAHELWGELSARLTARRINVGPMTLCYVPRGAFVMGTNDLDSDCAPPHLVELSAFYVAARPIDYLTLREWDGIPDFYRGFTAEDSFLTQPYRGNPQSAREVCEYLDQAARPPQLAAHYTLPSEAQWERVFRASYLRPDGASPYGVKRPERPEWTADTYDAAYYGTSPRVDPPGPDEGEMFVVRGAPGLPDPQYALYRDSARADGSFWFPRRFGRERWVLHDHGIEMRVVIAPESV